jgi:hypothetical protein
VGVLMNVIRHMALEVQLHLNGYATALLPKESSQNTRYQFQFQFLDMRKQAYQDMFAMVITCKRVLLYGHKFQ